MVVAAGRQIRLVGTRVEREAVHSLLMAEESEVAVGLGDGPYLRGERGEAIP